MDQQPSEVAQRQLARTLDELAADALGGAGRGDSEGATRWLVRVLDGDPAFRATVPRVSRGAWFVRSRLPGAPTLGGTPRREATLRELATEAVALRALARLRAERSRRR